MVTFICAVKSVFSVLRSMLGTPNKGRNQGARGRRSVGIDIVEWAGRQGRALEDFAGSRNTGVAGDSADGHVGGRARGRRVVEVARQKRVVDHGGRRAVAEGLDQIDIAGPAKVRLLTGGMAMAPFKVNLEPAVAEPMVAPDVSVIGELSVTLLVWLWRAPALPTPAPAMVIGSSAV